MLLCLISYPVPKTPNLRRLPRGSFYPQFHQSLNAECHSRSNKTSSESLTQTTPLECLSAETCLAHRAQADQMIHLKCLAVRTLDSRHVNMNHAMPHTATAVLFAGLLLLAQSDAQLPVTCGGSGWWGQKHTQVFWSSTQRSGPAVWRTNFIEMDWVKVFFFFLPKAQLNWVLLKRRGKKESQRQSRRDICLHNHLTEHWDFQRIKHGLPIHWVLPH